MEPQDLERAFALASESKESMRHLTMRIEAILDLYQIGAKNFLADPTSYDSAFSMIALSKRSKAEQKIVLDKLATTLLSASTSFILKGEAFQMSNMIFNAKKVSEKKDEFKIPGVQTPEMGESEEDLKAKCECGHHLGIHSAKPKEYCMEMDCECSKFKKGGKQ